MAAVASCLSRVAVHIHGDMPVPAIESALDQLFLALQQLHRLDRATGLALAGQLVRYNAPASALGKKSVTAAGAATGAGMGAAVDVSAGFLTLGAGAALGALLGAGIGWISALRHKKGVDADMLQRLTEAALLLYMEFSHAVRVHAGTGSQRSTWQTEIAREVGQRKARLLPLWSLKDSALEDRTAAEAATVLEETLQSVLTTLYPAAVPMEIVGSVTDV